MNRYSSVSLSCFFHIASSSNFPDEKSLGVGFALVRWQPMFISGGPKGSVTGGRGS